MTLLRNPESSTKRKKKIVSDMIGKRSEGERTGDDDRGTGDERLEVVLQPGDVENIQMIGRLVEEKNIGLSQQRVSTGAHKESDGTHLKENSSSESQLHLPSSGKRSDGGLLSFGSETDSLEDGSAFGFGLEDSLVLENERNDRVFGLVSVDVVLDVESSDLVRRRESFDLSVVDSSL